MIRVDKKSIEGLHTYPSANVETDAVPHLEERRVAERRKKPRGGRRNIDPHAHRPKKRRGLLGWTLRLFAVFALVVVLGIGGLVLYLSQGPVKSEQLRAQAETRLSEVLGPAIDAKIGTARLSFGKGGILALAAEDVELSGSDGGKLISSAKQVSVGVRPLSMLDGSIEIDRITLQSPTIDLAGLVADKQSQTTAKTNEAKTQLADTYRVDWDMKTPMFGIGQAMRAVEKQINETGVSRLELKNASAIGLDLFGFRTKQIEIVDLVAQKAPANTGLTIKGDIVTANGSWSIAGTWTGDTEGARTLDLKIVGINADEFLKQASADEGFVGISAPSTLRLNIPFSATGEPGTASGGIALGQGEFRMGREDSSMLDGAQLDFLIRPGANRIEIQRSVIRIGKTQLDAVGTVKLVAAQDGGGVLPVFNIHSPKSVSNPNDSPEKALPFSFRIKGNLDVQEGFVNLDSIELQSKQGGILGSGSVGLSKNPSLVLALVIPKMSTAAFKQLWPSSLASPSRKWVLENVFGGEVTDGSIYATIPAGVLGNLRNGKQLKPDYLKINLPISGARVGTYGKLPPIRNAAGTVLVEGQKTSVQIESGTVHTSANLSAKVGKSRFEIDGFAKKPYPARLELALSGDVSALMHIAASDPIKIDKVTKIAPQSVSGPAKVYIEADFPLAKKPKKDDIKWVGEIKLSGVDFEKPYQGRSVKNARLVISALDGFASIVGKANVDGVEADLELNEPFGKDAAKANRSISLKLDNKKLASMGISLKGILDGPVSVNLDSTSGSGGKQNVEADLTNASLTLPWVDWKKGAGIPAKTTFTFSKSKDVIKIEKFKLSGKGFNATGGFVLDKTGLKSAKLQRVQLTKRDNVAVTITRTKAGYALNVSGKSFDARSLIKKVLNQGTPKPEAAGDRQVTINARIGTIYGFGGQQISNVTLVHSQVGDRLQKLSLKAATSGNAAAAIEITGAGQRSKTQLLTGNAGSMLRFLDLYKNMRGGSLRTSLNRNANGVYTGPLQLDNFTLVNEPRLAKLVNQPAPTGASGEAVAKINPNQVRFKRAIASIEKGNGFLNLRDGLVRNNSIGASFNGRVYDSAGRMDLTGTFMPAYTLNRFFSKIPVLGFALGNGKDQGLLGITFKLTGKTKNPKIRLNPLSAIAPGIFRQIFEFK